MVDLEGTNPVNGDSIDTTDPGTHLNYLIGGTVLVGSVLAGKFVVNTLTEATGVNDTVSDGVLSLT